MPAERKFLRPVCWLRGHIKTKGRINRAKAVALAAFHPWAGEDWDCARCGLRWRDSGLPDEVPRGQ